MGTLFQNLRGLGEVEHHSPQRFYRLEAANP